MHRSEDLRLSRLTLEQRRREQRPGPQGPLTVEREVRSLMMFASTGFPAELDRETREFDPVQGMVFRKVRAQWTAVRGVVPELIAPPTQDVQMIADPCNPDYVGPAECPDGAAADGAAADDAGTNDAGAEDTGADEGADPEPGEGEADDPAQTPDESNAEAEETKAPDEADRPDDDEPTTAPAGDDAG